MSNNLKISNEELEKIKDIQHQYVDLQSQLGQSAINKLRLAQQIESLNDYEEKLSTKYSEIQQIEKDFIKQITDKYGDGTLDIKSGEYIKK